MINPFPDLNPDLAEYRYRILGSIKSSVLLCRVAHVMVEVSVMDLNDNPPMFVNQPYYAVVSKEAARDSQGMQMEIVKIIYY